MTLEQYLELENRSETHHEYFAGEIFEIEAASYRHQKIGIQLLRALDPAVLVKGGEMLFSGTRVATSKEGLYTYPDLVIVCGRPEFWQADPNALFNPKVIIEILSPSSGDYDRGAKFELYRTIPSLSEYLTVHQDAPFVEHHGKQPDGSWVLRDVRGLGSVVHLESLGADISFAAIYAGIELPPPSE